MVCIAVTLAALLVMWPATAQRADATTDRVRVIGTKEAPPFAMKGKDGSWTGISIDLWRRIADDLHIRYRFQEAGLDELIDGTAAGRLDAAIAAITVTAMREQNVEFTQPYYTTGLGIAVIRGSALNWLNIIGGLISVWFLQALMLLVGAAILVGIIVWIVERRHTEHFSGGVKRGLTQSVLWSALTLTQSMPEKGPTTLPGRIIAVTWLGIAVTALAVFTASVTTHLTTKELEGYVRGIRDLHSVRVGAVAGTASLDYLKAEHIAFTSYQSPDAGLKALKVGVLDAFVYDRPLLYWIVRNNYADSIQVLEVTFSPQNYAIALPVGSPLRLQLDRGLVKTVETQWWRDLTSEYLGTN
jgi:ABC-type amino acid transport substrate-binding protein